MKKINVMRILRAYVIKHRHTENVTKNIMVTASFAFTIHVNQIVKFYCDCIMYGYLCTSIAIVRCQYTNKITTSENYNNK